jgi:cystathionine gamma-synthase
MERHDQNARKIAEWLRGQYIVEKVFFAGFEDQPQNELSRRQARGAGGMISFYLKKSEYVPILLHNIALILFAESLGGVESLLTYPLAQTHAAIPDEMRLSAGVNDRLMRFSVGIEDADDLIADLERAFKACKQGA